MILVDANLLLYAVDNASRYHARARSWWDDQLSGHAPVGLAWQVLTAFIRIGTNPRLLQRPLSLEEAAEQIQSWLDQPCTRIVRPSESHWTVFQRLLLEGQATANLAMDAHLAALAIEHGCTLMSADADFARFPKLKWRNPLVD